jgi:hypothetical protein
MKKEIEMETIRLVLEIGEDVEITYPIKIADGMFKEMKEAQSRDTFWYASNYTGVTAMYKGSPIDYINMKRVVGMA